MAYTTLSVAYINGDIFSAGDINNTNTVANALSNGANQALIALKGDILTGSATANALVKTTVGSNNTVLYANSAASGGVSWGLITSAMITDATITGTDIASSTITGSNIATGTITSTNIADNTIVNGDINTAAAISDTKLATITTALKVSNSATTANSGNALNAIVARDGSGNFSAGTITATFSGTHNGASNGQHTGNQDGYIYSLGSSFGLDYQNAGNFGSNPTSTSNGVLRVGNSTTGTTCITTNTSGANTYHLTFHYASNAIGSISTTTSTTSFNTTSDYRLKENVVPLKNALTKIELLSPKSYNFIIAPDEMQDGFIAHEVANVVPYAVTGEKDAIDNEGNIKPQQVDYSKFVSLLVGAVQELSARVKELENN